MYIYVYDTHILCVCMSVCIYIYIYIYISSSELPRTMKRPMKLAPRHTSAQAYTPHTKNVPKRGARSWGRAS